jgi:hypothetical protein
MEGMQRAVSAGGKVYWREYARARRSQVCAIFEKMGRRKRRDWLSNCLIFRVINQL